jgi:hypothetical protein
MMSKHCPLWQWNEADFDNYRLIAYELFLFTVAAAFGQDTSLLQGLAEFLLLAVTSLHSSCDRQRQGMEALEMITAHHLT